MKDIQRLRHIMSWLNDMTDLCAPLQQPAGREAKLGAYASLLVERFSAEAFCRDSIEAVASKCKFFPSYSEVATHLDEWWRDNRPNANLIALNSPDASSADIPQKRPAPVQSELDAVERMVEAFKAERAAVIAASPEAKPKAAPLYVPDHLLLREYDKLAAQGDVCSQTRAALLRSRLGEKERGVRQ